MHPRSLQTTFLAPRRDFQREGPSDALDNLRKAASITISIATADAPFGAQYALAHGLRTGYFTVNAALGTLSFELSELLRRQQAEDGSASGSGGSVASIAGFGNAGGLGIDGAVASRLLLEAAMTFAQDYRAIRDKVIKPPWDMYTRGHRQLTPGYAARQTSRFVSEAIATLGRRARQAEPGVWMDAAPGLYPDYYKNDFHYQSDGWMASRSAQVYETSTETLFVGRQVPRGTDATACSNRCNTCSRCGTTPSRRSITSSAGRTRCSDSRCRPMIADY